MRMTLLALIAPCSFSQSFVIPTFVASALSRAVALYGSSALNCPLDGEA